MHFYSQLKAIEKKAFCNSSIEFFTIPYHLQIIGESAFENCTKLKKIIIPNNHSELKIICKKAFANSSIYNFSIPSSLEFIDEQCFYKCTRLAIVDIPLNSQLQIIGKEAFACSSIEKISIPSQLIQINEHAFLKCLQLKQIDIPYNSKLQVINNYAFSQTSIEDISIPSNVIFIGEGTFAFCERLKKFDIQENSQLQELEKDIFLCSSIENITITSNLILKEGWCNSVINLNKIKIIQNKKVNIILYNEFILGKSDSKNDEFDTLLFACRDIKSTIIPPHIKIIGKYAFNHNEKLESIIIPKNSKLQKIDEHAFSYSYIRNIQFKTPKNIFEKPESQLTQICDYAFYCCCCFKQITIPKISQLQIIGKYAFAMSSINNITIPQHVKYINEFSFYKCQKLKEVKFSDNSELLKIG